MHRATDVDQLIGIGRWGPKLHRNTKFSQNTTWNTKLLVLAYLLYQSRHEQGHSWGVGLYGRSPLAAESMGLQNWRKMNILNKKMLI
jgi:hypothetical protein